MRNDYFTIEINEHQTRVVLAERESRGMHVRTLGSDNTIQGFFTSRSEQIVEQQAQIVLALLDKLKVDRENAHVVIPDNQSFSQIVEMPLLKEKELMSAIRYQADEFIPMPIEETSIDIEILHENKAEKKVLLLIVACSKVIVEQIERTMMAAKVNPQVLENELSIIGRYLQEVWRIPGKATVLVNIGFAATSLYLYNPEKKLIVASRIVKIGYELFIRDVTVNLNLDTTKATQALRKIGLAENKQLNIRTVIDPLFREMSKEIQQFVGYASQKHALTVDKIVLYNNDVNIAHLHESLAQSLQIPVAPAPLDKLIKQNHITKSVEHDLSLYFSTIMSSIRET